MICIMYVIFNKTAIYVIYTPFSKLETAKERLEIVGYEYSIEEVDENEGDRI